MDMLGFYSVHTEGIQGFIQACKFTPAHPNSFGDSQNRAGSLNAWSPSKTSSLLFSKLGCST